ncbi:disintegrin and metalloproteinase domain-containing protein unc-71-like [Vespula maculifrons]|uniref:Disintegrin and metalloproteinase domain-containing protein unc-71-like n=1 Tax=Vespula maculifrons TaxID=7453 RepID=A0ABD2CE73_VESMC
MFWVHCGLFVLVIAVPGFISSADSTSKREQVVSSLYVARLVASRHVRRLDGILDTLTPASFSFLRWMDSSDTEERKSTLKVTRRTRKEDSRTSMLEHLMSNGISQRKKVKIVML